MSETKSNRRNFLKTSTAGALALSMGGVLTKKAAGAAPANTAWTNGMQINPAIDNLRVVVCNDPAMIKSDLGRTFQLFNDNVDTAKLQANMDKMAIALANKADAKTAWSTIFQKPGAKTWAQVKVAIKVNCIDANDEPRLAIVDKICRVLNTIGPANDPGVPFASMTIYDASQNCAGIYGSAYSKPKLPTGVVAASSLGSQVSVTLPKGAVNLRTSKLTDGSIDILVNIACNKGHDQFDKGKCTMCLKNHYGTFETHPATYPRPNGCGDLSYLIDINKSDAIVGGTVPRQQLCIVDSLWAMVEGPTGGNVVRNDRLVMGTFAGAVDYLVARKIRQTVMNIPVGTVNNDATHTMNDGAINGYLTGFGYDLAAANVKNLDFIDALAYTPVADSHDRVRLPESGLTVFVQNAPVYFSTLPASGNITVDVLDVRGRIVRSLTCGNERRLWWDGMNARGHAVAPGSYAIRCTIGKVVQARNITIK